MSPINAIGDQTLTPPEDEARIAVSQRVKYRPSEEEVREHELTHLPYISWCELCIRGKAQAGMHRSKKTETENQIPTISIDYTFPGIERESDIIAIISRSYVRG